MTDLSEQHIATIKDAAKKLTGAKRRAFQAQVAMDYMNSKPHLAEKTFGWDRKTVALGLNELRTGLVCFDNFKARGNKKTEVKMPQLEIAQSLLRIGQVFEAVGSNWRPAGFRH